MPLKINCLLNDTAAVADIKDAMAVLVAENLENGKVGTFPSVYRALRSEGVEIDMESAGALYNELFSTYTDSRITPANEVMEKVGKPVEDTVNDIADDIIGGESALDEKQIGNLSPEKADALKLAKLFQDTVESTVGQEKSDMLQMQEMAMAAIRTLLPKNSRTTGSDVVSALRDFFRLDAVKFDTIKNSVNTFRDLFEAIKTETDNMLDRITAKLNDEDAEMVREKWENYFDTFQNAAYDILLGQKHQNQLIKEGLKQIEVNGVPTVDINNNIRWGLLMEHDNPAEISASIAHLFRNGIKDGDGQIVRFPPDQAQRIGDYFQKIYEKKLAEKKLQKLNQNRTENTSSKNLISDFIKDQGFFRAVKDKQGKLLLAQTDWKAALEAMRNANGTGLTLPIQKLRDFLASKKDASGNRKYTDSQIDIVVAEFERTVAAKMLPGTATPNAMQRLIALNTLNAGKSFQTGFSHALNTLVGVPELSQELMDNLQNSATRAANILSAGNVVSPSTSRNPLENAGAHAYLAQQMLDRTIRENMRTHKTNSNWGQLIVKFYADLAISAANSKLTNPRNILENIFTAVATNIAETIALLSNGREFGKFIKRAQSEYWTAWGSHFGGGVADDIVMDEDYKSDIQTGERLRAKNLGKAAVALLDAAKNVPDAPLASLKEASAIAAKTTAQLPAYAANMITRGLLNTFDAATNEALLSKSVVGAMYDAMMEIAPGLTKAEKRAKVIKELDGVFNMTPEIKADLDAITKEVEKQLRAAGETPTAANMAQIKNQMQFALYEQAFMNLNPEMSEPRAKEVTKAVIEGASNKARALGGKRKMQVHDYDLLTRLLYGVADVATWPQRKSYEKMTAAEKEGKLGAAALHQAIATVSQVSLGLFVGGSAKFAALGLTATPYGFVNALGFRAKANKLKTDKNANDVMVAEPGDIRGYAEIHGMVKTAMVRAALGTLATAAAVLYMMSDDDDDEKSAFENLMRTQSGQQTLKKFLPWGMVLAAFSIYDVYDKKGKIVKNDKAVMDFIGQTLLNQEAYTPDHQRAFSKAESWDDKAKVLMDVANESILPTFNFNQAEQFTRFAHVMESMSDRSSVSKVLRDEGIASSIYKAATDLGESFFLNGMMDIIRRWNDDEKKVNRFSKN